MKLIPRILLTMGEAAGIGPELLVKVCQQPFDAQLVVLADPQVLLAVASKLGFELKLKSIDWNLPAEKHCPGVLYYEPVNLPEEVVTGKLNPSNSAAILAMLKRAGELAISKSVDAVVTAPVHKAVLNQVDQSFLGHTEFFAAQANIKKVVMLLATNRLRIALVTTHLPLNKVSQSITAEVLRETIEVIDKSFRQFDLIAPRIAVCGLNPHAGEDGLLGTEDRDVIAPQIEVLKSKGVKVQGPFPADSLFTQKNREIYDVFLAMYHDQGLPVVKAIGFGECANITLGLPYIRTSVDHGTAIDIADQYCASSSSLEYAINYALSLAKGKLPL
jgi:4-hydroxythreonine-4-phosphate dehydrogenase